MTSTDSPVPGDKAPLVSYFANNSVETHNSTWSKLWEAGETLWDRGKPSPALIDILEQRGDLLSPSGPDGRRKRALVPGCGRGYDVVMLALHGFDAYGLDVSEIGLSAAKEYADRELQNPQDHNFGASWNGTQSRGTVAFIQADFFAPRPEDENKFDVIYDYTFLCALHPTMRSQWASRMAQLLAPGGVLVCLEFPLFKDPTETGPPWSLKGVHWDILARGGDGININLADNSSGGSFKRLLHVKPERSYESGKGTDMLSIWELK
ncbi:hypothetical protein N7470_009390 [Penicillium chermesinum]|nr:hypothetical protein N7470_009390 [Penicillium chermesinum]